MKKHMFNMNKNKFIKYISPAAIFFIAMITLKVSNIFNKKTNPPFLNYEQQYAQVTEPRRTTFFDDEIETARFNSGYLRGGGEGGVRTTLTTIDSISRIQNSPVRGSSSYGRPPIAEHFATGGQTMVNTRLNPDTNSSLSCIMAACCTPSGQDSTDSSLAAYRKSHEPLYTTTVGMAPTPQVMARRTPSACEKYDQYQLATSIACNLTINDRIAELV